MLVVAGVLLGLVGLLAVPVGVAFRLRGIEPLEGRVTIRWLFGLVRVHVPVPRPRAAPAGRAEERRTGREKAPRAAGARGLPTRTAAVLREGALRRRVHRLAEDLLRALHVSRLRLRMRVGLGDPADTGRLWALLGPLGALATAARSVDVRMEPEFIEPVLEFDARGRLLIVPLQVAFLAFSFALSPTSVRAFRTLRGSGA